MPCLPPMPAMNLAGCSCSVASPQRRLGWWCCPCRSVFIVVFRSHMQLSTGAPAWAALSGKTLHQGTGHGAQSPGHCRWHAGDLCPPDEYLVHVQVPTLCHFSHASGPESLRKGPIHRTISLNTTYIVLFKNCMDMSQVSHLDKQISPGSHLP